MSISTGSTIVSLEDFTAYELPTKRWMQLIRPKMRLRVLAKNRAFVSSAVKVDGPITSNVHWPWSNDGWPSFADDEVFEVEVERRFLFRYKCIRRTRPMTIDQVRTGDLCALPLYDGQRDSVMLEDGIIIGEITFGLRSDASGEGASLQDTTSFAHS